MTEAHIELDPTNCNFSNDVEAEIDHVIAVAQLKAAGWSGHEVVEGSIYQCDALYFYCADTGRVGAYFIQQASVKGFRGFRPSPPLSIPLCKNGSVKIGDVDDLDFARELLVDAWAKMQSPTPFQPKLSGRLHLVVRFQKGSDNRIINKCILYLNDDTVLPYWDFIQCIGVATGNKIEKTKHKAMG